MRYPDVIQPCGDGYVLMPMGDAASVAGRCLLFQLAVGDNLILHGSGDDEFAGGFVGWMIYSRQPLMGQVRPVGAEKTSLAILVLEDLEPASRDTMIFDGELTEIASLGRLAEGQDQAIR